MERILNLAGYRFVAVGEPEALADAVRREAGRLGLKGTVLLAEEGLNFSVAGEADAADAFVAWLRRDARFADLSVKRSWSETVPFGRLRVKVKPEIIRMDSPAVRPAAGRAPGIDAATLDRWLDAGCDDDGRPIVLLDTRNAFEVDRGAFRGAVDWRLARFGDFPAALAAHRAVLAGHTVVAYCTGGIRCEKAALLMQQHGIDGVRQLDGGILGYLDATRSQRRHWRGECVVFDDRGTLDAGLAPAVASPMAVAA